MTRIDYHFADGTFRRIRLSRVPKDTAKVLVKWEQKEEYQTERDCRYRHGSGYIEGDSETSMREVNYSDPVADAADDNARSAALRDAVSQLNPVQQRRIWLYAQGYSHTEIAAQEGVYEGAVRKSIKLAKKKIKRILENGYEFGSLF